MLVQRLACRRLSVRAAAAGGHGTEPASGRSAGVRIAAGALAGVLVRHASRPKLQVETGMTGHTKIRRNLQLAPAAALAIGPLFGGPDATPPIAPPPAAEYVMPSKPSRLPAPGSLTEEEQRTVDLFERNKESVVFITNASPFLPATRCAMAFVYLISLPLSLPKNRSIPAGRAGKGPVLAGRLQDPRRHRLWLYHRPPGKHRDEREEVK